MDFHLKQWRNQQYESENQDQHSAKIPKLLHIHENTTQYQKPEELPSGSALPLFVPDQPNTNKISTHLSPHPFPHQNTPLPSSTTTRLPKMGSSYFSMAQWQELELQALIFRYMLAGAAVPAELLQPIKKSINLLSTPQYFLHHQHPHPLQQYYPHYQPSALFQTGYWGRAAMDPEPGRCRRTDGKKWRCSRDVVVGQKYCERHMHRGKNRSRKPVEVPTPAVAGKLAGGGGGSSLSSNSGNPIGGGGGAHFALSGPTTSSSPSPASVDLLRLSRSSSGVKRENEHVFEPSEGAKSGGHVLRHFFDDWPRSLQEPDNVGTTNNSSTSSMNSSTSLSISMPGNLSSDVSLKLSTGDGERPGNPEVQAHSDRQLGWSAGWGTSSMGGPLAEALRLSNSNSSPTSVLHQLPRGSASETCIVSS